MKNKFRSRTYMRKKCFVEFAATTGGHLDKVEKMVREHFPHADFEGFSMRDKDCK